MQPTQPTFADLRREFEKQTEHWETACRELASMPENARLVIPEEVLEQIDRTADSCPPREPLPSLGMRA